MADEKRIDGKDVAVEPEITRSSSLGIAEASHEHADEALGFIEKHEGFTFTAEQDQAVLRKIDLRILPLVGNTTHIFSKEKTSPH
jgi:hypothetical protein